MKRLYWSRILLLIHFFFLNVGLSIAQSSKKDVLNESPSWEIGTDFVALTNLSTFPIPKYSIFARKNIVTDKGLRGIRGRIGISVDNAFPSPTRDNDDLNEWYVRGGYEWQRPILKRYKLFYGLDAHYFSRRVDPSRPISYTSVYDRSPYFSAGEKVDQWGVDPFVGFKAYLFSCLSVSIETGMAFSYHQSTIRYFSPTQEFANNTVIENRLLLRTVPLAAFNISFEF